MVSTHAHISEPHTVDLAAQHGQLVAQDNDLEVLRAT